MMEYNVNMDNKLDVGDTLRDDNNMYVVVGTIFGNTHSQYASKVDVKCTSGPHRGRVMSIDHCLATQYKV